MANPFDTLYSEAVKKRILERNIIVARDWFRRAAAQTSVTPAKLMKGVQQDYGSQVMKVSITNAAVGRMYFFNYDPKLKKKLPYYDRYPLIFPISREKDSFLGLNLHYLPPKARAQLMDALYNVVNNDKYDSTTKLQLSYNILKSTSKFRYFKPCIKKYLNSHVKSQFMMVPAKHWDTCLFLPIARFEKATDSQVWKDSINIANK